MTRAKKSDPARYAIRRALDLETAHEQALAENAARDLKLAA